MAGRHLERNILHFLSASLFTLSKPEERASKNSFCSEPKATLTIIKQPAKTTQSFYHVLSNLIGWFLTNHARYSSVIVQFHCSVLRFPIENSSNKSTSCFMLFFKISKIMKLIKKNWKKPRKVFPRRFAALTGRLSAKLGDFLENPEGISKTVTICYLSLPIL